MKIKDYYKEKQYIHYSNCHEDFNMLNEYVYSDDRKILSVASALDNSLSFLVHDNVTVDAFDFNITQIYLCKLKKLAIKNLTRDEFMIFIGISEGDSLELYNKFSNTLDKEVKDYFDAHLFLINEVKLVNAGKFEYYFQVFAKKVLPLVVSKKHIKEFAEVNDLLKQQEIYRKYINTLRFRLMFKIFFSKKVMKKLGRDKEFFKYNKGSLSKDIKTRFDKGIAYVSNGSNPYLNYVLLNQYKALPFYLQEENYQKIKQNIDNINICYANFDEMIENENYDFMNLSDIFEYMPESVMSGYSKLISRALNKHGRVAFWNMVNTRKLELTRINQKEDLEKDRALYYKDYLVYKK